MFFKIFTSTFFILSIFIQSSWPAMVTEQDILKLQKEIIKVNKLNKNGSSIKINQELKVTVNGEFVGAYTVEPGDTISHIAQKTLFSLSQEKNKQTAPAQENGLEKKPFSIEDVKDVSKNPQEENRSLTEYEPKLSDSFEFIKQGEYQRAGEVVLGSISIFQGISIILVVSLFLNIIFYRKVMKQGSLINFLERGKH